MTRALEGAGVAPALTTPTTETCRNGHVPTNGHLPKHSHLPNNGHDAKISARTIYRDFLIELEENARGWRVLRIVHCLTDGKSFSPAGVYHRDRIAAENGGRALIDARRQRKR